MTTVEERREAWFVESKALADELGLRPHEAAELASRYAALKDVNYVTADGDKLSSHGYKRELEYLNQKLKEYLEEHGSLLIEGVGVLRLQERSGGVAYDLEALYRNDLPTFVRLLEKGCLSVNQAVLKELQKAGQIAFMPQGMPLAGTRALVIDRPK